ncbi:unnamed protein product [Rotaria socialis]|uniref:ADP ribosyltransferase domain-containing protein n=1 Tax=Rotaria socialis TaxID=392032 RepID=A0A817LNF9_9BILA|nr:unnamed protein product [Rotaria socialis]CAF3371540.1 unnamed protein product [Rotaria socialis]CAF3379096.1 unnamed protein product [Rotaria socialis]CAF3447164.1 unnamed protein product [Rotaria socialis]CAF3602054.1 unnamed protein product [Rotaria socialis]
MIAARNTSGAIHDDNLETFSLIWLDANIDATEENKRSQQQLRAIINRLITFHDEVACQKYITSRSEQDRIVLIVSGRLGRALVPKIHHCIQLSSAYVYCQDKNRNKQWSDSFAKVKGVFVEIDELIREIKAHHIYRGKLDEPMSMNIYNVNIDENQSTTELNGRFIHFLLLIDVLIRVKFNESDKQKLITRCIEEYHGNDPQISIIREFECDYIARKALWWYTRDSFLYNMLNKALRTQNTELLFLLRFLIRDIYQQLKTTQCHEKIRAYRYQSMSQDELKTLQRSIGHFISINSFFSTSARADIALRYADHSTASTDLHRILFVIDANARLVKSKPFADISSLSYFSQECEILFMVGCIFRINKINWRQNENIWIIEMQLASDDEHDLKNLFYHLKKDYGGDEEEVDLISYGDVLHRMGKYDLAKKVYSDLRKTCSSNDTSFPSLCFSLGLSYRESNDFNRSLRWFQKALDNKMHTDPNDHASIGGLYCSIGNIHLEKRDYTEAKKFYEKSKERYQRDNVANHPDIAYVYHGLACIHYSKKEYSDAMNYYKQSLAIQDRHLPANHPNMAMNYSSIGDIHRRLSQYSLAMEFYKKSLDIREKSLPPLHPDIAASYQKIGLLFDFMRRWTDALENYQRAALIYHQALSPTHPKVIKTDKYIQRVASELK